MKTFLFALIAILVVSQYRCKACSGDASSAAYCKNLDLGGYYRCCFEEKSYYLGKVKFQENECQALTRIQYISINAYISGLESQYEEMGATSIKVRVDCSSQNLVLSLISLLLLLF